jgi:DNA mismatch repair ATPase MutL
MKTILRAMLGIAVVVSPLLAGQEPAPEKEKRKQEETKKQPPPNPQEPQTPENPKPKPDKPQPQPSAPPKQQRPDEKQQQEEDKAKQKQAKEDEKKARDNKQQPPQAQGGRQNTRTQQSAQTSHQKSQRIPPEKFQSNFGSQHRFHVHQLADGRRFQHGGYWFELVEVWPADWSYDDDCYIEEDADDYYIVDLFHPGVRISVIVVEG